MTRDEYDDGVDQVGENEYDYYNSEKVDADIQRLRKQVRHPKLPQLPYKPDGVLFGVIFFYDEDRDDRILVAIEKYFAHDPNIIAVREHEGGIDVYCLYPTKHVEIEVCFDIWVVQHYTPKGDDWNQR